MNDDQMRRTIQQTHDAVIQIKATCSACSQKVLDHEITLDGPPSNGNSPGLKTRMDRQERFKANATWAFLVVGSVVGGLLLEWARACFVTH